MFCLVRNSLQPPPVEAVLRQIALSSMKPLRRIWLAPLQIAGRGEDSDAEPQMWSDGDEYGQPRAV